MTDSSPSHPRPHATPRQIRIAHFSDTHVLSLKGVQLRDLLNKRLTGAVNLALNRAKHYRVEVFEELLDAVVAVAPDHSLCTGDLVNLALKPEFERVHELLSARFTPEQLTLVPGNHDYYTKEASLAGRFEEYFSAYLPHESQDADEVSNEVSDDQRGLYPISRQLNGAVRVVGVNTAIPTGSFLAHGEVGAAQRARLDALLHSYKGENAGESVDTKESEGPFTLLMLHHPLFPEPKRRLDMTRRLSDADELLDVIDQPRSNRSDRPLVDLVIHGHNHEFKRQALPQTQTPVIQVASASRTGKKRAEFHVYVIEGRELKRIERHIHVPDEGRFMACDERGEPLT